ncbi:MAG: hypothetical protein HFP78_00065 [Methylococcales symbiont of Hymedesmia sp. n. MRB-2018]|nr:MAG: hypothetical protein HFP78_00065 [Methylococcales symbiont of Hymedesmia sp. n. MRB-2018]
MKLKILPSILIFVSAYSPLSIIFLIQDFDWKTKSVLHPEILYPILGISFISIIFIWVAVKFIKVSTPPVKVLSVSNKSGELINYSIPYMISFSAMDLSRPKLLISFGFFMLIMYVLTLKTHNIFINPILAVIGYNIYDVKYQKNNREYQSFFLIKGKRLKKDEKCRIAELSEHLFLVTERNPGV